MLCTRLPDRERVVQKPWSHQTEAPFCLVKRTQRLQTPPASLDSPNSYTPRKVSTRSSCENAILSTTQRRHLILKTGREHAASDSYAFFSASPHTVPRLIQRAS